MNQSRRGAVSFLAARGTMTVLGGLLGVAFFFLLFSVIYLIPTAVASEICTTQ